MLMPLAAARNAVLDGKLVGESPAIAAQHLRMDRSATIVRI